MLANLKDLSWVDVENAAEMLRGVIDTGGSVQNAAGLLANSLRTLSDSCVLARVFMVLPASRLPSAERDWATTFARTIGRTDAIEPKTPVLTLLGTAGADARWNDRTASAGHRAIPLFDREFIEGAPMIAALLHSLSVDLETFMAGSIQLKSMPIASNARFFVEDGATAVDAGGRPIIGARDFVENHHIRSVFGMGGSYLDGEIVAAICFTNELLTVRDTDRFTPLLSAFKIATTSSVRAGRIF